MLKIKFDKKDLKILHIGLCATGKPYNGFQQAFIDNCFQYEEINCGISNVNEEAVRLANQMQPDLIFMQIQTANVIHEKTIRQLKATGAYIVNWTGDVREDIPTWMIELAPHIDNTLFSNMVDVKKMRALGFQSDYLEIGINEKIYTSEGKKIKVEPIVFFGNNYGTGYFPMSEFRIKLVSWLKQVFGSRFGIYGNGYFSASGNFSNSQEDEAAAYRGSKMAVNVSHFEYERYSSDRLLRILGSGTLCLAKWYPAIEQDFTDGVHLRVWRTLDELVALCNYYLDERNEKERKAIAKAGMELSHEKFTFNCMVLNLLKIYKLRK
jgi:spore maturation protein CgeB